MLLFSCKTKGLTGDIKSQIVKKLIRGIKEILTKIYFFVVEFRQDIENSHKSYYSEQKQLVIPDYKKHGHAL